MKYALITFTALIAIAAIITDQKYLNDGEVTSWGWWFMAAIIVSTIFTIVVEIQEHKDKETKHTEIRSSQQETLNQLTGGENHLRMHISTSFNPNKRVDGFEWFLEIYILNPGQYPVKDAHVRIRQRFKQEFKEDNVIFEKMIPVLNNIANPIAPGQTQLSSNALPVLKAPIHDDVKSLFFVADIYQSNKSVTQTIILKKVDHGPRGWFWSKAEELTDHKTHQAQYTADPDFPKGADGQIDYSTYWDPNYKD